MQKVKSLLKSLMAKALSHPIVVKLLHTFWQSFLAVWLVGGFKLDKVLLTAAIAAGFSAVKTLAVTSLKARA